MKSTRTKQRRTVSEHLNEPRFNFEIKLQKQKK